jgi:hypothetical protein
MGAREGVCVAGQTVARRDTGLLRIFMLGCVLVATTVLGSKAEEVRRFDKNRHGKHDQWEYYQSSVLLRVEVDRTQDGRIDETTFYEEGRAVRAECDTDSDVQVDRVVLYESPERIAQVWENLDAAAQPRTRTLQGLVLQASTLHLVAGVFLYKRYTAKRT